MGLAVTCAVAVALLSDHMKGRRASRESKSPALEQVTKDTRSAPEVARVDKHAVDALAQSGFGCTNDVEADTSYVNLVGYHCELMRGDERKICAKPYFCTYARRVPE